MEKALRKVGFWVAVGLVALVARPLAQSIAAGPAGELVPGVRKLVAT